MRLLRPAYLYGVKGPDGRYARNFVWLFGYPQKRPGPGPLGQAKAVLARFPYLVYGDSRDPNSAAQILKWFRYGFFPKQSTLVLTRLHVRAAAAQIRQYEREGVAYLLFWPFDAIDLGSTRAVFYPYNTNTNQIIVKQNGPLHVFAGHGDSDKAASINPMKRMYDHLLVSGDLTVRRLLESRIMSPYDAQEGRMIKVGMPYLEPLDEAALQPPNAGYALYAPTWEGVERRQQYSSLEGGFGAKLVGYLLQHYRANVVFRPHPSTGQKRREYRKLALDLIAQFGAHPRFFVHADPGATFPPESGAPRPGSLSRCTPSESLRGATWVIADVSSMVSSALYAGRPVVVIKKSTLPDQQFRTDVLSELGGLSIEHGRLPAPDFLSEQNYARALERVRAERQRCVGHEPYLAGLPRERWVDAIVDVMERGKFRR